MAQINAQQMLEQIRSRRRNVQSLDGADPDIVAKDPQLFDENGLPRNNPQGGAGGQPSSGRDPGVQDKDPRYFDENGLPIADGQTPMETPYGDGTNGGVGKPDEEWDNPYDDIQGNGVKDAEYWKRKLAELKNNATLEDPTNMWDNDDWQGYYDTNDQINVKEGGNEHFGQKWDPTAEGGAGGWVDIDSNSAEAAEMFAEADGWDDEFEAGLRDAWANNDEREFQRWRNLGRAYRYNQNRQAPPSQAAPSTPAPSSGGGDKPSPPKAPPVNSPTYNQPQSMRVRQSSVW